MRLEWFVWILVPRLLRAASDVALRSLLVTYFLPHMYFYISFVYVFTSLHNYVNVYQLKSQQEIN